MTQLNLNFNDWQALDEKAKLEIINNVWNPFNPKIGFELKNEIVENFIKGVSDKGVQYGIANFGWYVYMLYVIVEDSKIRIPKHFAGLPVNKGTIKAKIDEDTFLVKMDYGGTTERKIKNKIEIK